MAGAGGCLSITSESEFTPADLAMFYEFTIMTVHSVLAAIIFTIIIIIVNSDCRW